MNIGEVLRISWEAILKNKIRSLLTMLGIIIGVAAVIMMIAISAGTEATMPDQITSLGSNLIFISPSFTRNGPQTGRTDRHRAGLHGCGRHPAERPERGRRQRGTELLGDR